MSRFSFRTSISFSRTASSSLNLFSTSLGPGLEKYSSSCWPRGTWDGEEGKHSLEPIQGITPPPLPPFPGPPPPASGSHHNGLASAKLPNDGHLESSLINSGQCGHHCLHSGILGGWWGQPHGAGCIRDPRVPIQLKRSRDLESRPAKHENPLAHLYSAPSPTEGHKFPVSQAKYLAQVDGRMLPSAGEDAHGDKVESLGPRLERCGKPYKKWGELKLWGQA